MMTGTDAESYSNLLQEDALHKARGTRNNENNRSKLSEIQERIKFMSINDTKYLLLAATNNAISPFTKKGKLICTCSSLLSSTHLFTCN